MEKKIYTSPAMQVVNMEMTQNLLAGSSPEAGSGSSQSRPSLLMEDAPASSSPVNVWGADD